MGQFVSYSPKKNAIVDSENSFLSFDGKQVKPITAWKYEISISCEAISSAVAKSILDAIEPDTFNITFSTPQGEFTREFRCHNKPSSLQFNLANIKRYWKLDLTFEEV